MIFFSTSGWSCDHPGSNMEPPICVCMYVCVCIFLFRKKTTYFIMKNGLNQSKQLEKVTMLEMRLYHICVK